MRVTTEMKLFWALVVAVAIAVGFENIPPGDGGDGCETDIEAREHGCCNDNDPCTDDIYNDQTGACVHKMRCGVNSCNRLTGQCLPPPHPVDCDNDSCKVVVCNHDTCIEMDPECHEAHDCYGTHRNPGQCHAYACNHYQCEIVISNDAWCIDADNAIRAVKDLKDNASGDGGGWLWEICKFILELAVLVLVVYTVLNTASWALGRTEDPSFPPQRHEEECFSAASSSSDTAASAVDPSAPPPPYPAN
jgi:hypothetical protein